MSQWYTSSIISQYIYSLTSSFHSLSVLNSVSIILKSRDRRRGLYSVTIISNRIKRKSLHQKVIFLCGVKPIQNTSVNRYLNYSIRFIVYFPNRLSLLLSTTTFRPFIRLSLLPFLYIYILLVNQTVPLSVILHSKLTFVNMYNFLYKRIVNKEIKELSGGETRGVWLKEVKTC